jgi:hypothetical protein
MIHLLPAFLKKGIYDKWKKIRLQREFLDPLGAFILEPSGKPIS